MTPEEYRKLKQHQKKRGDLTVPNIEVQRQVILPKDVTYTDPIKEANNARRITTNTNQMS